MVINRKDLIAFLQECEGGGGGGFLGAPNNPQLLFINYKMVSVVSRQNKGSEYCHLYLSLEKGIACMHHDVVLMYTIAFVSFYTDGFQFEIGKGYIAPFTYSGKQLPYNQLQLRSGYKKCMLYHISKLNWFLGLEATRRMKLRKLCCGSIGGHVWLAG